VDSQHYYAAYPHATANDVRAAARVRREARSTAIDLEASEVGPGADVGLVFDDLARRLSQCLGPVGRPADGWEAPPAVAEGHIQGVAGVFPVLPGHEELLSEAASALGEGPASPFFMVPGTHFARLALLHRDKVGRYPGGRRRPAPGRAGPRDPVPVDRLANSYLVLAADVDGAGHRRAAHDRFFRTLFRVAPGAVDSLFSHCWGYASVDDDRDFADLAWRCRRPVVREYMDYSDESLRSVLAALAGHPAFVDLLERRRRGQPVTPLELAGALR
jgi:hypothetical protein